MISVLAVAVVLTGAFGLTFAIMSGLQKLGCFDDSTVRAQPRIRLPRPALPLGADDDPAFLGELRRQIESGHFRH